MEAAWELQHHIVALTATEDLPPGGGECGGGGARLPRSMAGMAAVLAQRQRLHAIMRVFLDRASTYLSQQLTHLAGERGDEFNADHQRWRPALAAAPAAALKHRLLAHRPAHPPPSPPPHTQTRCCSV